MIEAHSFKGKNLAEVYGPNCIHFHSYPIYTKAEREQYRSHPLYYFYHRGYLARDAGSSRILPVSGGKDHLVILPKTSESRLLFDYYKDVYGTRYTGDFTNVRFFEGEHGYIELLKRVQMDTVPRGDPFRIVVLHPYLPHHIDPMSLYVDSNVLAFLNKKINLSKLSSKAPKRVAILREDFEKAFFEKPLFFPCVVKGNTGCSGSSVFMVSSIAELLKAQGTLRERGSRRIVIEEYCDHDESLNVQFCVSDKGEIFFLHLSQQRVKKSGTYLGNLVDLKLDHRSVPKRILETGVEVCKKARKLGWYGLVGIDILHRRKDDRVRVVDLNFRWNGSSTLLLLRRRIRRNTGERYVMGVSLYPKIPQVRTFDDALHDLKRELGRYLFVVGAANRSNRSARYRCLLYAGITGDSTEEINERIALLGERYNIV